MIVAVLVVATAAPVTMPVNEPTVATEVVPLVHVPPASTSDNVVVCPAHITNVPEIAVGKGFTVTIVVIIQPGPDV